MSEYSQTLQINVPEYTHEMVIGKTLHIHLIDKQVPNWLHRKMMSLVFGFEWKKLNRINQNIKH